MVLVSAWAGLSMWRGLGGQFGSLLAHSRSNLSPITANWRPMARAAPSLTLKEWQMWLNKSLFYFWLFLFVPTVPTRCAAWGAAVYCCVDECVWRGVCLTWGSCQTGCQCPPHQVQPGGTRLVSAVLFVPPSCFLWRATGKMQIIHISTHERERAARPSLCMQDRYWLHGLEVFACRRAGFTPNVHKQAV